MTARHALDHALRRPALRLLTTTPPGVLRPTARWLSRGRVRGRLYTAISRLLRDSEVTVPNGRLAGLRLVATGSSAGYQLGITEPAVQEELAARLHSGMSFYDIGANIGFFTMLGARLVGPTGHVCAFEPLPGNLAVLRRNLKLNGFDNVTVIGCAVSATGGSGWLRAATSLTAEITDAPSGDGLEVEVVAIDELLVAERLPAPDVIKLDVEGHEPDALRGMLSTLRRFGPSVICEVHDPNSGQRVAALLEAIGYTVSELLDEARGMRHVVAARDV